MYLNKCEAFIPKLNLFEFLNMTDVILKHFFWHFTLCSFSFLNNFLQKVTPYSHKVLLADIVLLIPQKNQNQQKSIYCPSLTFDSIILNKFVYYLERRSKELKLIPNWMYELPDEIWGNAILRTSTLFIFMRVKGKILSLLIVWSCWKVIWLGIFLDCWILLLMFEHHLIIMFL